MLYQLQDLMKAPVKGYFYREQLTPAPSPNYKSDYFLVEKILKTKVVKNKKFYYVKFMYYPEKFNQYIPESNLKIGEL